MGNFVAYQPKQYPSNLLPKDWSKRQLQYYADHIEFIRKVHNVPVYDDDVWLVTLPKCGTTWMQELLWLVLNDFNFEGAKAEHLEIRTPFMEFEYGIHRDVEKWFESLSQQKRPRLIKTHMSLPLLPSQIWNGKTKVIYVARNIKDAFVSKYYHDRSIGSALEKTLDDCVQTNMEGNVLHDPFLHITEFYALRHEPWLFYTSFERMKLDLHQVIMDICKFLDKPIDDITMERMLKHLSFKEMRTNPKTNHIWEFKQMREKFGLPYEHHNFLRKGEVNAYREELSPEMVLKLDTWVEENLKEHNVTLDELLLLNDDLKK